MALAKQGIGITMLPETLCAEAIRNGELEVVLPEWRLPQGIAHLVFASRRGLLPAVRALIDFLAEKMPALIEESSLNCRNCPPVTKQGKPIPDVSRRLEAGATHATIP